MIGTYPAESFFFINPETGIIYIRQSLKADSLKLTEYMVCVKQDCGHQLTINRRWFKIPLSCYALMRDFLSCWNKYWHFCIYLSHAIDQLSYFILD